MAKNNKKIKTVGIALLLVALGAVSIVWWGTNNPYYVWEDKSNGNWYKTDILCSLKGCPAYMCSIHCVSQENAEMWDACGEIDPERNMAYGVFEKHNSNDYNMLCFYPQSCHPTLTYDGKCEVVCPL